MNKNELLDEMNSSIELSCGERDDEMEENTVLVSSQHL